MTASLFHGPGLSILVHAAGLAIGLLVNAMLARWLSPAGYGVYGFTFGLVSIMSVPLHTGLATLVMRDAAHDMARHDFPRLAGLLIGAPVFALSCSMAGVLVLLAIALANPWGRLSDYVAAFPMAMLLLPGLSLAAIVGAFLRGIGHPSLGQLPDSLLRPLLFALLIAAAWRLGVGADGRSGLAMHAFAAAIAIGIGIALIARRLPKEVFASRPDYAWRSRIRALLPFSLLAGVQALGSFIATASLGLSQSPAVVGTYRLAELGGGLVSMPLGAVSAFAAAGIARAHALDDAERLQREVTHSARQAMAVAIPIALCVVIGGGMGIELAFGPAYEAALQPMLILCAGALASTMAGPAGAVATMCGHHREAVTAVAVGLGVQVLLNVLLVPSLGATGAAIAASSSMAAWSHWLRFRMLRITGVRSAPWQSAGGR